MVRYFDAGTRIAMSDQHSADRMLKRDEVVEILRVHPDTVYQLVRELKIPASRLKSTTD